MNLHSELLRGFGRAMTLVSAVACSGTEARLGDSADGVGAAGEDGTAGRRGDADDGGANV